MCVHVHSSYTHSSHSPAAAVCQLGDIERETQQPTAHNKNTRGDNRRLTTVFRRGGGKKAQRKRQTVARNADGIRGRGEIETEYKQGEEMNDRGNK